jgi:hypothetical protein
MKEKLFLAIFLLAGFIGSTSAQSNPEQAILSARDEFFNIKSRSIELERTKRDASKRPLDKDSPGKFPEIKEDFEQIQKLNNSVLQLNSAEAPLNYQVVLKFVSEINRRAVRLRLNLFSAESKAKNKQHTAAASQDIKTLLADLDKFINKFAHSSIFQNTKLVNSEDSLKAQKDLETVIAVSNSIKAKTKN